MPRIGRTTRFEGENYVYYLYLPVYGLQSDLDTFEVSVWEFHKYSPETLEGIPQLCVNLRTHLSSYPPDFLAIWKVPCDQSMVVTRITANGEDTDLYVRADALTLAGMVRDLLTSLRLYKEGAIFTSGLWSYATGTVNLAGHPGELDVAVADDHIHVSTTIVSLTARSEPPYYIDSTQLADLEAFIDQMTPSLEYLQERRLPNFDHAVDYFNCSYESKALRDKFKDLVICLEALLVQKTDNITNSLARRVAALVGTSEMDKKTVGKEMSQLYDVRSRLVHGSDLKPKHLSLLNNVVRLREIARRSILGSISLLREIDREGTSKEFYELLEEIEVNDDLRSRIMLRAMKSPARNM